MLAQTMRKQKDKAVEKANQDSSLVSPAESPPVPARPTAMLDSHTEELLTKHPSYYIDQRHLEATTEELAKEENGMNQPSILILLAEVEESIQEKVLLAVKLQTRRMRRIKKTMNPEKIGRSETQELSTDTHLGICSFCSRYFLQYAYETNLRFMPFNNYLLFLLIHLALAFRFLSFIWFGSQW